MKNIKKVTYQLLIPIILISVFLSKNKQQIKTLEKIDKNTPVLECYINTNARCIESAYCRACKNCSSCKHCSNGGSCGLCSVEYKVKRRKTYYKTQKSIKGNIYDGRNNSLTMTQQLKEELLYLRILVS